VYSDSCVANARATGLAGLANDRNACIGFGTAATGAGSLGAFATYAAGGVTTAVGGALAPVVGFAGVVAIGTCLLDQAAWNSHSLHIRGAAQACGDRGIIYRVRTALENGDLRASSTLTDFRCQNGPTGTGTAIPPVQGLDWTKANGSRTVYTLSPKAYTKEKNLAQACIGNVAVGDTDYMDVPAALGTDWTYLARKLVKRTATVQYPSLSANVTYTETRWNKTTGMYDRERTIIVDCPTPPTEKTIPVAATDWFRVACSHPDPVYFELATPNERYGRSYRSVTHANDTEFSVAIWDRVSGKYLPSHKVLKSAHCKTLTVTTHWRGAGYRENGTPYNFDLSQVQRVMSVPSNATWSLSKIGTDPCMIAGTFDRMKVLIHSPALAGGFQDTGVVVRVTAGCTENWDETTSYGVSVSIS
jgi:hypothetical protein